MLTHQYFIHPEDEADRRNMEAAPGFLAAVKASMEVGMEQYFQGVNMATKIWLSQKQLPELYAKSPRICKKMGIYVPISILN